MPITIEEDQGLLRIELAGRPSLEQYERSVPRLETAIAQEDRTCILVELGCFEGWDLSSRWDPRSFDIRGSDTIEKVAFVGAPEWKSWLAGFHRQFDEAAIRFFPAGQDEEAEEWLASKGNGSA